MTARDWILSAEQALIAALGPGVRVDAGLMAAERLQKSPLALRISLDPLSDDDLACLNGWLGERLSRRPLQYILGFADLMGHRFQVREGVLIPRFDTECVIEEALSLCPQGARVLDLCTGSGAIGLSIAKARPDIRLTLSDISPDATACARENAARLGIPAEILQGDFFAPVTGRFDLIVCNPPYIKADEIADLSDEVLREPRLALDGGPDGLVFYRRLCRESKPHLTPRGIIVLEAGDAQEADLLALLRGEGFRLLRSLTDMQGKFRGISAQREQPND